MNRTGGYWEPCAATAEACRGQGKVVSGYGWTSHVHWALIQQHVFPTGGHPCTQTKAAQVYTHRCPPSPSSAHIPPSLPTHNHYPFVAACVLSPPVPLPLAPKHTQPPRQTPFPAHRRRRAPAPTKHPPHRQPYTHLAGVTIDGWLLRPSHMS